MFRKSGLEGGKRVFDDISSLVSRLFRFLGWSFFFRFLPFSFGKSQSGGRGFRLEKSSCSEILSRIGSKEFFALANVWHVIVEQPFWLNPVPSSFHDPNASVLP